MHPHAVPPVARSSARIQQQKEAAAKQQAAAEHEGGEERVGQSSTTEGRTKLKGDIQLAQNMIERCLQMYMPQKEVIRTLQAQAKIEPGFTRLVWQKLEEQNKDFFEAYHLKLKLKEHVVMFNHLLEQQQSMMAKLHSSWVQSMPGMVGGGGGGGMMMGGMVAAAPGGGGGGTSTGGPSGSGPSGSLPSGGAASDALGSGGDGAGGDSGAGLHDTSAVGGDEEQPSPFAALPLHPLDPSCLIGLDDVPLIDAGGPHAAHHHHHHHGHGGGSLEPSPHGGDNSACVDPLDLGDGEGEDFPGPMGRASAGAAHRSDGGGCQGGGLHLDDEAGGGGTPPEDLMASRSDDLIEGLVVSELAGHGSGQHDEEEGGDAAAMMMHGPDDFPPSLGPLPKPFSMSDLRWNDLDHALGSGAGDPGDELLLPHQRLAHERGGDGGGLLLSGLQGTGVSGSAAAHGGGSSPTGGIHGAMSALGMGTGTVQGAPQSPPGSGAGAAALVRQLRMEDDV